jgi:hypothetical protein
MMNRPPLRLAERGVEPEGVRRRATDMIDHSPEAATTKR